MRSPSLLLARPALRAASRGHALDAPSIGANLIAHNSFEDNPPGAAPAGQVPEGRVAEAYSSNSRLAIVAGGAPGAGEQ